LHDAQLKPNGSWTGWTSLGGVMKPNPVAVALDKSGSLEVFVLGQDDQIWRTVRATNGTWVGFTPMPVAGYVVAKAQLNPPAAVTNVDGRIEVLATDGVNAWDIAQPAAGSWRNAAWSTFQLAPADFVLTPAAAVGADGRVVAYFARDLTNCDESEAVSLTQSTPGVW
jgi:hypothetical protein